MKLMDLQSDPMNVSPNSESANQAVVNTTVIQRETSRIDSKKNFDDVRAKLERLPRFDDRTRDHLKNGEIDRVKSELQTTQGEALLIIFSIATHGDWLKIISGKRKAAQYVIRNVLISDQLRQHKLDAGPYVPLRVMVYEGDAEAASLEPDRASTLFDQFGDERVTVGANELDQSSSMCRSKRLVSAVRDPDHHCSSVQ